MRYSENELHRMACAACTESTMQGKLYYKGIQQGKLRPVRELQGQGKKRVKTIGLQEGKNWVGPNQMTKQPLKGGYRIAFREREFRLQGNFLFYYKTNEDRRAPEPLGALLLERCTVQREMSADKAFVFSIAFQDDRERKHMFLASSAQLCDQWVLAIRSASYEQLKATWIMLHSKIKRLKDMTQATDKQQQQEASSAPSKQAPPPRPAPPRPPPPSLGIQPARNAPPPPSAKAPSTSQEPAEGLLLDFS